ncbi:MAG: transposase YhgA family protein [Clostridiales bacterium]|nr:transposase YhgA family protein [Clostridiales bacterium]
MTNNSINNIHDKSYKDLFSNKETFLSLLQTFVNNSWGNQINKEDLVLVNKSYVLSDYEEMESDIVYKARLGREDVYFYILLEFQSIVDYRMPIRLLLYMIEIWREVLKNTESKKFKRKSFKLPPIIPIVLYNGNNKWTAARSLKEVINHSQIFGENILDFQYELIDINSYNKVELYEKQNITSAIFLLDQNIDSIEFINRLKDVVTGFNRLTLKEKDMLKHWLLNTVAEEDNFKENVEKIFNADIKEVEEMTSNISKGLEKLKQEGIEQGKQAGELAKAIEIAERLLRKGDSIEEVAEVTELSKDKVLEIKNSLLNK